jgi:ribonuclease HI
MRTLYYVNAGASWFGFYFDEGALALANDGVRFNSFGAVLAWAGEHDFEFVRCGQHERVLQGGVADTTNNRMELIAAIEGLRALKRASQVTVLTDSEYVRRGITEFLPRWKANGWRASTGKPVVNRDLWEELEDLAGYHDVTWIHVRGHSGQPNHERCDSLAVTAARSAKLDAART